MITREDLALLKELMKRLYCAGYVDEAEKKTIVKLLSLAETVVALEGVLPSIESHKHTCETGCKGCVDDGAWKMRESCIAYFAGRIEGLKFCPINCKYLFTPERHPTTKNHICQLFGKKVIHAGDHPRIHRCDKCLEIIDQCRTRLLGKGE